MDSDDQIYLWDVGFYSLLSAKRRLGYHELEVAEYFPVMPTIIKLLGVLGDLFGMSFERIVPENAHYTRVMKVYADRTDDIPLGNIDQDFALFAVYNEEESGGGWIGWLLMDLLERDGESRGARLNKFSNVSALFNTEIM